MDKTSKIYIAGHRGMVGAALMRMLQANGYDNIVSRIHSELDLTRQAEVEDFFAEEKPEYVFLSAAKVGGILANDTYKAEFIYDNMMIAANVVHAAYKNSVNKILNFGSSCIFPKLADQPMKEKYLLTGALEPTNEPYAIAKIAALKLCRYYNEQYGTNYISVMPTNLYGPNDNFNLETAHVFAALLRKFHLAELLRKSDFESVRNDLRRYPLGFKLDNKKNIADEKWMMNTLERLGITEHHVTLWGKGEVYREFLHADDLADACLYLMLNVDYSDLGEFVNIGTGKDVKIIDLAILIKEIVGFEGEIKFDHSKPDGTPRKLQDVSKAKSLGWEAKISLEKGIIQTYDWYCKSCS